MHKSFLALVLLSLSVSTGAVAQERGTPEEQKACHAMFSAIAVPS